MMNAKMFEKKYDDNIWDGKKYPGTCIRADVYMRIFYISNKKSTYKKNKLV